MNEREKKKRNDFQATIDNVRKGDLIVIENCSSFYEDNDLHTFRPHLKENFANTTSIVMNVSDEKVITMYSSTHKMWKKELNEHMFRKGLVKILKEQ